MGCGAMLGVPSGEGEALCGAPGRVWRPWWGVRPCEWSPWGGGFSVGAPGGGVEPCEGSPVGLGVVCGAPGRLGVGGL